DSDELKDAATAMLARPQTELAGLRTLAMTAHDKGDIVGALNHAHRALARKDAPEWALRMVIDIEIAGQHWREAIAALESRLGRDVFSGQDRARLKSQLLIQQAQAELRQGN